MGDKLKLSHRDPRIGPGRLNRFAQWLLESGTHRCPSCGEPLIPVLGTTTPDGTFMCAWDHAVERPEAGACSMPAMPDRS